jgi:hypothetical protein
VHNSNSYEFEEFLRNKIGDFIAKLKGGCYEE